MFTALGNFVNRSWLVLIVGWVAVAVALKVAAPDWGQVAQDGQFSFLPDTFPSRRGDELLNQAFPHDLLSSSVVIVVSRDSDQGLEQADLDFVSDTLKVRLVEIASADADRVAGQLRETATPRAIGRIRAFDDPGLGKLMMSADRKATLVILELTNDFFSRLNRPAITAIEDLLKDLRQQNLVPTGLEMHVTGSAVVGRDVTLASERSAAATELWTIGLVTILTLVVFRAPLLALIPLVTLYIAMEVSLKGLSLLAGAGVIGLFKGIESYSTVVVYASGVDYCLFLISRFQEELKKGSEVEKGVGGAIGKVGAAIAASSATEIAGIGMLGFATFGKFHQAGIAIALSLVVMLAAVLTFTPSLLRLVGRKAFWPYHNADVSRSHDSGLPVLRENRFEVLWERIAAVLMRRPGTCWLATTALMAPFAVVGVLWYNHLNYDLIGNLPRNAVSALGTSVLERHFSPGTMGPVNVLIRNEKIDFRKADGFEAIKALTDRVNDQRADLNIADIRSASAPLGTTAAGKLASTGGLTQRLLTSGAVRRQAMNYFVSDVPELDNHLTRLELELTFDPFSESAIDFLDPLEAAVRRLLPSELESGSELTFSGSTVSLRDLKTVGMHDRTLINWLVVASVTVILVILLRRFVLTLYLVLTVIFSYLVTLGVTFCAFYLADPQGFPGLDWMVPLFLFTVLIAIGEDYNILLVTRIQEEEIELGPERGIEAALTKTGPIISSCGLIMAGTFLSLAIAGQLAQMIQLGFALAFGVLLDTFVVRPILVPSYMLMMQRRQPGLSDMSSDQRECSPAIPVQVHSREPR